MEGLDAVGVANEHPWHALIIELSNVFELLHERQATKGAEVAHCWLAPAPSLIQCLVVETSSGRSAEEMDGGHHRLPLVERWHSSLLEDGAHHCHHSLIPALDNAILLWGVWGRVVALDPLVGTIRGEFRRHELAAIVHAQHPHLATTLLLCCGLDALDGFRPGCLRVEQDSPHVA